MIPLQLKSYVKSRVIHYLSEAKDFSANILHIPGQPARIVFQLGSEEGQGPGSSSRLQSRSIVVRNLPPPAEDEEYLNIFFECKKRQGGGPVKSVTLFKDSHSAIIEFEQSDAVRLVMEKIPITMHGSEVHVEVFKRLLDEDERVDTVQIKGLQLGLADDIRAADGGDPEANFNGDKAVTVYGGDKAAKVWHFCQEELENLVSSFGASIVEEPETDLPEKITITTDKMYKSDMKKRLRVIEDKIYKLNEASIPETDLTEEILYQISIFNSTNRNILILISARKKTVVIFFDGNYNTPAALETVKPLFSNQDNYNSPRSSEDVEWQPEMRSYHDEKRERTMTVAMEIGATHTRCGFSFIHEFQKDPSVLHEVQRTNGMWSNNMPTVILYQAKKYRHFGFEAERCYEEMLCDNKDMSCWYYFKRFPLALNQKKVNRDITVKDERGRLMPAKMVFADTIRFLKLELNKNVQQINLEIRDMDIHWMLVVPALWSDSANQLMRESAQDAGIEDDQLSIVPDAEAAALCYLEELDKSIPDSPRKKFSEASLFSKYVTINLGGEIVYINAYIRYRDGVLKELYKGNSESLSLSKVFSNFLQQVGGIQFKDWAERQQFDFHYLQREFEIKIRGLRPDQGQQICFRWPRSLFDYYQEHTGKSFEEGIKDTAFREKLCFQRDKCKIDVNLLKSFFQPFCDNLVEYLRQLFTKQKLRDTDTILMFGELFAFPLIKDSVKRAFPKMQVNIPNNPVTASLNGAVIFGHKPVTAAYRQLKFTYGIVGPLSLDETDIHTSSEKNINIYFPKGECVRIGENRFKSLFIQNTNQRKWQWKLFVSQRRFVTVVDETLQFLATLTLSVPASGKPVKVDVGLMFGEKKIISEVRDVSNDKISRQSTYISD